MKILALTILIAFTFVFDLTEGRLTLVGCYNSPNILLESNYFGKVRSYPTTLTREVCASWCYAKSNVLFFGLHHATDCYCLEYGIPKFLGLSAQCTTPCSGPGASTYCGGQYALRVYYESDRYPDNLGTCLSDFTLVYPPASKLNIIHSMIDESLASDSGDSYALIDCLVDRGCSGVAAVSLAENDCQVQSNTATSLHLMPRHFYLNELGGISVSSELLPYAIFGSMVLIVGGKAIDSDRVFFAITAYGASGTKIVEIVVGNDPFNETRITLYNNGTKGQNYSEYIHGNIEPSEEFLFSVVIDERMVMIAYDDDLEDPSIVAQVNPLLGTLAVKDIVYLTFSCSKVDSLYFRKPQFKWEFGAELVTLLSQAPFLPSTYTLPHSFVPSTSQSDSAKLSDIMDSDPSTCIALRQQVTSPYLLKMKIAIPEGKEAHNLQIGFASNDNICAKFHLDLLTMTNSSSLMMYFCNCGDFMQDSWLHLARCTYVCECPTRSDLGFDIRITLNEPTAHSEHILCELVVKYL
ncbi:hypothetical protein CAPTEDRAFT_204361 [Capitella teleta]|uniref:WSC domain-containing protein n=1 Tax=Capitella teleta TaxID=283909 RepID=R7TYQ0_CAPTE|nr:hypothetical protein CAPTEDRAFT_204361 [Capitella teleta]|eukprot:ELT98752.1 hypothetical protein CAPTEDRAFT_204361 [Capitella teleta]